MFSFLSRQKKVLVVEDSESLAKAVSIKLKSTNYGVLTANSYNQAIKYLKKNKNIRAIWLDHWLHGKETGLDVLRYVKQDEKLKDIPVFIVSSSGDEWSKMYEELGVTKYYIKSDHLMATIIQEITTYLTHHE